MSPSAREPRRHEPPPGWPPEVFERVTDALASALVAALRRRAVNEDEAAPRALERAGAMDRQKVS